MRRAIRAVYEGEPAGKARLAAILSDDGADDFQRCLYFCLAGRGVVAMLDDLMWLERLLETRGRVAGKLMRHHAEGIFMLETLFGVTITNSDGRVVPVRQIGEQHVTKDLGRIPSFADWAWLIQPAPWVVRGKPAGAPALDTTH